MGFHLGLREGDGDLYWCALLLFFFWLRVLLVAQGFDQAVGYSRFCDGPYK